VRTEENCLCNVTFLGRLGLKGGKKVDLQAELNQIKKEEAQLQERRKNLIARQIWDRFDKELSQYDREARIMFCTGMSENISELTDEMIEMLGMILKNE
jgi:predicted nuclease with TOPRIM domain